MTIPRQMTLTFHHLRAIATPMKPPYPLLAIWRQVNPRCRRRTTPTPMNPASRGPPQLTPRPPLGDPRSMATICAAAKIFFAIFAEFAMPLRYGAIARLAREHPGFWWTTIHGSYDQWNRRLSHRAMTAAQEEQVVEVIEGLWDRHEHISAQGLSTIAKDRWIFDLELSTTSRFPASASFGERFLRDHDCSMRTPTRKKKVYTERSNSTERPTATP
jgi:hypothetical protein